MTRSLLPWTQLTRSTAASISGGEVPMPQFQVVRRPLPITANRVLQVGELVPADAFPAGMLNLRLRQYYESRKIAPVVALGGSQQVAVQARRAVVSAPLPPLVQRTGPPLTSELPLEPPPLPIPETRDHRSIQVKGKGAKT